jgi:hypothetical protein
MISRLTLYMWGYSVCCSEVFLLYTVTVLFNTFLSVDPVVLLTTSDSLQQHATRPTGTPGTTDRNVLVDACANIKQQT